MSRIKNRRSFLNRLVLTWAGITSLPVVSTIYKFINPPKQTFEGSAVVGTVSELTAGTDRTLMLGNRPVIVITVGEGRHRAYRANCTHLGCVVKFRADHGDIYCACHGSIFNLDGVPVKGPASRPLEKIPLKIENEHVVISTV